VICVLAKKKTVIEAQKDKLLIFIHLKLLEQNFAAKIKNAIRIVSDSV